MNRSTLNRAAGALGIFAALGLAGGAAQALGASPAAAQTPPTVPAPCADCDNADTGIPAGPGLSFGGGFACEPSTGYGVHTATAWVPKTWPGPVAFYFPAATPQLVKVAPGKSAKMTIRAPSGVDVFWVGSITGPGVNRPVNQGPFRCDCSQFIPPFPTTPPTSSSVTTPPSVVTTTPGTPSTTPHSSSVPGTPTALPLGTLPATGSPTDGILFGGVVALAGGAFLLYVAARKIDDDA